MEGVTLFLDGTLFESSMSSLRVLQLKLARLHIASGGEDPWMSSTRYGTYTLMFLSPVKS
jgi:hypothetical protein